MKSVACQQVSCGYSPSTVLEAIRGQSGRFPRSMATLVDIGGQHVSRHTIRYAGKATLEAHPDERLDNNDATWVQTHAAVVSLDPTLWHVEHIEAIRSQDKE